SKARIPCSEEDEMATLNGVDVICHDGYWVPASSSSAVPTSSYFDMTNQFNEKVSYGEFTDPRDGQKYRTVNVYDGKFFTDTLIFFAENLNFGKMVPGGTVLGDSTKYCYDDDPWYCDNGWGGLYTWSAAMNITSICDSVELGLEKCPYEFQRDNDGVMIDGDIIHQGICPEGWHIVHDGEWAYLQQKSGSSASYLGSKVAGFGNNSSGLSILPTGSWERYPNGSLVFRDIKKQAIFWTAQQSEGNAEKAFLVSLGSQGIDRLYKDSKSNRALSIRCVKNY
ncbi:FISUMP domain-containing protein, partial [Fibrobacter sp. HC4]|uniref:FISUMP domain-containing protein n=1 Tax=Fibrobacter sp. HC4 TaxID=3239812 RepID=UPI0020198CC4